MVIRIGTAGWSIPRSAADEFPTEGSSLERYAAQFGAVEINSSFHRGHRQQTWARWHDSVPKDFRFAVKLSKEITHSKKLLDCSEELQRFVDQVRILREKLAVVLVQLPPKLAFDSTVAEDFFKRLHMLCEAAIVCEPRHISWFSQAVSDFLERLKIGRVAADPAICPEAASPGGWPAIRYWRLHGSPIVYRSSYQGRLENYVRRLRLASANDDEVWCIFDNTATSAATSDALELLQLEASGAERPVTWDHAKKTH
jgi:uncharacterized protein YecE (DUF72 family)